MGILELGNLLKPYLDATPGQPVQGVEDDFNQLVQSAPHETVSQGLADAFRSDHTPAFGEMVGQLFGRASGTQQAGLLTHLLGALGPGILGSLAGGVLGRLQLPSTNTAQPAVTSQQASQLSPAQVSEVAEHAAKQDPSVIDRVSSFVAQHPQLVQGLGGAALTIALAKIAQGLQGSGRI